MTEQRAERHGWNTDQRLWFRRRDSDDMQHPEDCRCQWHTYQTDKFVQCRKTIKASPIEIHHIYPQSAQKRSPKQYGGANPFNGIALCAGIKREVGHHDLLSPQMIIAKARYPYDRNSFHDSFNLIQEAEDKGISMHDYQYDGFLKQIARARTDLFLKRFPADKFPYKYNPPGETSLKKNAVIFDNHV